MKPDIGKLAKQHGFEVERTKKHKVYKRHAERRNHDGENDFDRVHVQA